MITSFLYENLYALLGIAFLGVFTAPALDLAAGCKIAVDNWRAGKPVYAIGTRFSQVCLPSGQVYRRATLERKDFYRYYLRLEDHSLAPIAKRHFISMAGHGQIALAGGQDNLRSNRGFKTPPRA